MEIAKDRKHSNGSNDPFRDLSKEGPTPEEVRKTLEDPRLFDLLCMIKEASIEYEKKATEKFSEACKDYDFPLWKRVGLRFAGIEIQPGPDTGYYGISEHAGFVPVNHLIVESNYGKDVLQSISALVSAGLLRHDPSYDPKGTYWPDNDDYQRGCVWLTDAAKEFCKK